MMIVHGSILTMDKRRRIIEDGAVCIDDRRILDVGTSEELLGFYEAKCVIDARKKVVMPGLIDTHGHPFGLIKAIGEHVDTKDWVRMRHFSEFRGQNEESFYIEGLLSAIERLKFGTTFGLTLFNRVDDPVFASMNAEAVQKVGIRGIIAIGPLLDRWPKIFSKWEKDNRFDRLVDLDEIYKVCERFLTKWPKKDKNKVFGWLGTSNLGSIKESEKITVDAHMELSQMAHEFDVGITTHASGGDVEQSYKNYNILGPNTLLVHCPGLSDKEIQLLKITDTNVSHNPSVIGFMASSSTDGPTWPPIVEMIDSGIIVGLGTDGPSGRITTFDMFREIKLAMMIQRLRMRDRWVMPPGKVLEMATVDAARVLGMETEIGSLEPGKRADIIIVDMYKPHLVPIYMIPYRLTYEAQGQDVDTVIVDGEVIMENRVVKTVDEEMVLEQAQNEAERIIEKCGLGPYMKLAKNFWGQTRY